MSHEGKLNAQSLESLDLEGYLAALDSNPFVTDYLERILKGELFSVIFEKEQSSLTFSIQKYKKLRKLPLTQFYIPAETREILDMISENSVKEFLDIKIKTELLGTEDIVGAVMKASTGYQDLPANDQFYTHDLREAYYSSIIKDCLKKGLTNLSEYSERLNRVEDTFMKKTLTRSRIPLADICLIVKTPQFKKSELRNQLVRFFKTKERTTEMC